MNQDPQFEPDLDLESDLAFDSGSTSPGSTADTMPTSAPTDAPTPESKSWMWAVGGVIAVLVIAIAAFMVARGGDDSGPSTPQNTLPGFPSTPVGVEGLRALASTAGQSVYWVGPEEGYQYRIVRRADGGVQIDYLPADGSSAKPLVGTYAVPNAYDVTQGVQQQDGDTKQEIAGGGVVIMSAAKPTNVYIAYPGIDYQIEIFHPDPGVALRLARDGRVAPLG